MYLMCATCVFSVFVQVAHAEDLVGGAYSINGASVNTVSGTLQGGSYVLQADMLTVSGVLTGSTTAINTGYLPTPAPTVAVPVVSSGGGGGGGGGGGAQYSCPVKFNPEVVIDPSRGVVATITPPFGFQVVLGDQTYSTKTQVVLYPAQTMTYAVAIKGRGMQTACTATVQVLSPLVTAETVNTACSPFTKRMKIGAVGAEVKRMQAFLKSQGYKVDRIGVFGFRTEKAVIQFQKKYLNDVVIASGSKNPTGLWYEFTMKKANQITGCTGVVEKNKKSIPQNTVKPKKTKTKAPTLEVISDDIEDVISCKPFQVNLQIGSIGAEVRRVQKFLISQGYDLDALGIFGPKTKSAIEKFQSLYANEIIAPTLSDGPTGLWYEYTRKKANQIMGCK
jgi:peptidoglycan hydrolase-like protein with peptidoglycan-binding domain